MRGNIIGIGSASKKYRLSTDLYCLSKLQEIVVSVATAKYWPHILYQIKNLNNLKNLNKMAELSSKSVNMDTHGSNLLSDQCLATACSAPYTVQIFPN